MYQLFKGYVKTLNKKCVEPFKGKSSEDLRTLRDAETLDEYAGILNNNAVLIDVDNYEMSEILMKIVEDKQLSCRVYETTRGKHFLFKNDGRLEKNWIKKYLACGLKSDGKLGSRNSYSVLKYNNKTREIIYDIYPDEEYQTVPKWLIPIKGEYEFLTMGEGDGRNEELFKYILTLQGAGFTKDEVRETITIINDYVLKEPLSEKELETILRDEAFLKPVFYDGKTFLHDKFSQFLISEYNIIKISGLLYSYKDGVYIPSNIESLMIKHIPRLKQQQRKEVLSYLNAFISENKSVTDANFIAFKNGVYNIVTGELEPFTADKIITNKINWDYNPDAYSEITDSVLNRLAVNDENIRRLLEEVIGYTFFRKNELRRAFLLKSRKPSSGKSTFIDMLAYLLGDDNISSLDLSDLSHEYKLSALAGRLANLGDDIEDEYIPSAGIFKKVVSGDRVNANVKFSAPIEFNPYCKLIFSGNSIPRLGRGRDSEAIISRLVIVPFNAEFNKNTNGFSPFIKYQLRTAESMEYLIKVGIEGLKRVLERNAFTSNKQVETELEEYEETLNPILTFFEEIGGELENEPTKKAYRRYNEFCIENAMKPISQIEFTKRVKEFYGYENKLLRINGKPTRIFVKKESEVDE